MRLSKFVPIAVCITFSIAQADDGLVVLGKLDPQSFTSFPVEHGRAIRLVSVSESGKVLFAGGDGLVMVGDPLEPPRSVPLAHIPLGASHTGAAWVAADTSGVLVLPDAGEPAWIPLGGGPGAADHPAWVGLDSPCAGSPGCPVAGPRWPPANLLHTPDVTYIDLPGSLVALDVAGTRVLWVVEHEATPFMSAQWVDRDVLVRTVQARSELTRDADGTLRYRGQLSQRSGEPYLGYGFRPEATLALTISPTGETLEKERLPPRAPKAETPPTSEWDDNAMEWVSGPPEARVRTPMERPFAILGETGRRWILTRDDKRHLIYRERASRPVPIGGWIGGLAEARWATGLATQLLDARTLLVTTTFKGIATVLVLDLKRERPPRRLSIGRSAQGLPAAILERDGTRWLVVCGDAEVRAFSL